MRKILFALFLLATGLTAGWFFIPGAYWTFQDGTVGLLYVQGEYPSIGWSLDGRYSISGDYWFDADLHWKLIGERTSISFSYACDSLEKDYRKLNIQDADTSVIPSYDLTEYSVYLRQNFNAGRSNKFFVYTGYKAGKYRSRYSFDISSGGQKLQEETRVADAIDLGFEFSIDSRDDPENPQTAYYFGIRVGGYYFPSAGQDDFDYLDDTQLTDPEKEFRSGTGYVVLDQRFFGKLKLDEVPFPLILAMRMGLAHHIAEVPQLVAFKAGEDDFLRGIDKRHIMGRSYYIVSGELRAQIWEESYTPLILLHWLIPGYENPRPILEIVPIAEAARFYGDYVRDEEQQFTFGLGIHWVFSDFTVMRFDVCRWGKGDTWGAYFSFEPSI